MAHLGGMLARGRMPNWWKNPNNKDQMNLLAYLTISPRSQRGPGTSIMSTWSKPCKTFPVKNIEIQSPSYIGTWTLMVGYMDHKPFQGNLVLKGSVPSRLSASGQDMWCIPKTSEYLNQHFA